MSDDFVGCPEELCQQSKHSPGIVENEEDIARIVIAPEHIDTATRELKPGAFRIQHLKGGLSLVRMQHADQQSVESRAVALAERRDELTVEGLGITVACEIRSLRDEEERQALCVLDDGEEDFPAHAMAIRSADQSDSSLRKLRGELIDMFMPVVSIGQAFS